MVRIVSEPVNGASTPEYFAALVGDSRPVFREGIKSLVLSTIGKAEFLEAADATSLVRAAKRIPAAATQLAFVNLGMPGLQRGRLLGEFALRHPQLRIVVIESFASADLARRAMNIANVYACVPGDADAGIIQAAIRAALNRRKLQPATPDRSAIDSLAMLTPRQNEIHALLRRGMSNKVIASTLRISEGTVKNHVTEILRTLNATNRTQAAQFDHNLDRI